MLRGLNYGTTGMPIGNFWAAPGAALSLLLCFGFGWLPQAAGGAGAAVTPPTTIHILRTRLSWNHAASKFTYYTNYGCWFSKFYASRMATEQEPLLSRHARAEAIAAAPPVGTYAEGDAGEVEEYFAPSRYARYERSTRYEGAPGGGCAMTPVRRTKVQIAQGTRVVNATTKNGKTTVSDTVLQPSHLPTDSQLGDLSKFAGSMSALGGGGYAPGTLSKEGPEKIAGQDCDLVSSSKSTMGMSVNLCVWRGMKTYPTPLGPREIVLKSETQSPSGTKMASISDPISLDLADTMHWTEEARVFEQNQVFSEDVFRAPQSTR